MRVLLLPAALLIASCSNRPDDVLPPDKLASVLADINTLEGYYAVEGVPGQSRSGLDDNDSIKTVLMTGLLAGHGLTREQFDHSLDWYGRHIDQYEDVCDRTLSLLEARRKNITADPSAERRSDSLWPYDISVRMAGNTARDTLAFCVTASSIKPGDRLAWRFNTTAMQAPLDVTLAVDYSDGSTVVLTRKVSSEGKQCIEFQTDSTLTPRLIYGTIAVLQKATMLIDSVDLSTTPLSTTRYYDIHAQQRKK